MHIPCIFNVSPMHSPGTSTNPVKISLYLGRQVRTRLIDMIIGKVGVTIPKSKLGINSAVDHRAKHIERLLGCQPYKGTTRIDVKICHKRIARLVKLLEPPSSYHRLYHLIARHRGFQKLQILYSKRQQHRFSRPIPPHSH